MRRPVFAVVLRGADKLATVISVHETREEARTARAVSRRASGDDVEVLPVFYRERSEDPRPGDRLDVWEDGSTHWLVASR